MLESELYSRTESVGKTKRVDKGRDQEVKIIHKVHNGILKKKLDG